MAWSHVENRYDDDRVSSACGLFGLIDTRGWLHDGLAAVEALDSMKERGNGLGSGYAVYGCYPDLAETYALHVMCRTALDRQEMEAYLSRHFAIEHDEPVPHWPVTGIEDAPIVWRFFCTPRLPEDGSFTADEWVVHHVMYATWVCSRVWATRGRSRTFIESPTIRVISGRRTIDFPPTRLAGGVARTPLACWIGLWSTMARYPLMAPTGGI
jgi:glutamate synthase domain-containing protein 1